jgi:hypothetical protein
MAPDPLEAALDELYAADPAEFVAVRKTIAARLKADGEAAPAKVVAVARRPTTAAAALNRMAREQPDRVEAFLARSADLESACSGSRDDIRAATRAHRDALAAATDAALARLDTRPTDAYRAQIQASLHAASLDDAIGEQLRKGRVVKETSGPTGFGDDGPPSDDDEPAPKRTARKPALKTATSAPGPTARERAVEEREREAAERERRAAAEAERRRAELHIARTAAEEEATTAESAARQARERVDAAKRELEAARAEAKETEQRASAARRAAEKLERRAGR